MEQNLHADLYRVGEYRLPSTPSVYDSTGDGLEGSCAGGRSREPSERCSRTEESDTIVATCLPVLAA